MRYSLIFNVKLNIGLFAPHSLYYAVVLKRWPNFVLQSSLDLCGIFRLYLTFSEALIGQIKVTKLARRVARFNQIYILTVLVWKTSP